MPSDMDRRAIAYLTNQLRPAWPQQLIEVALRRDQRELAYVTLAAIKAATSSAIRHPNAIPSVIAEQIPHQVTPSPPGIDRCPNCDRIDYSSDGIDHNCTAHQQLTLATVTRLFGRTQ